MPALADLPRYAIASAFSFCFVIAATAGLHEIAGLSQTLAPAVALVAAFAVNFVLLRRFVFPGQSAPVGRQLAETAVTSLLFRALEYAIFLALHLGLDVNYLVATGASVCISALGKYFVYREIVFNRARSDSAPSATEPAIRSRAGRLGLQMRRRDAGLELEPAHPLEDPLGDHPLAGERVADDPERRTSAPRSAPAPRRGSATGCGRCGRR